MRDTFIQIITKNSSSLVLNKIFGDIESSSKKLNWKIVRFPDPFSPGNPTKQFITYEDPIVKSLGYLNLVHHDFRKVDIRFFQPKYGQKSSRTYVSFILSNFLYYIIETYYSDIESINTYIKW